MAAPWIPMQNGSGGLFRPESFEAFKKLTRFTRIRPVLYGLSIPIAITAVTYAFWSDAIVPILIGWYAALLLAVLVNAARFVWGYLGWEKRLPFALVGWRECLLQKHLACDLCWTDLAMDVDATDAASRSSVRAALERFCARANESFYARKMSADGVDRRTRWTVVAERRATGSANPDVLRDLKYFLQHHLPKRAPGITRVTISVTSDEYEEPIEVRSSEGTAS